MDTVDSAITKSVRRLEVFTGAGRRRTWSDEDKARVVAEIETSGDSVSGVARRHGLSPQQLFGWRRQVKEAQAVVSKDDEPRFVPAVVDAAPSDTAGHLQRKTPRRQRDEPLAGTTLTEIPARLVVGVARREGTVILAEMPLGDADNLCLWR